MAELVGLACVSTFCICLNLNMVPIGTRLACWWSWFCLRSDEFDEDLTEDDCDTESPLTTTTRSGLLDSLLILNSTLLFLKLARLLLLSFFRPLLSKFKLKLLVMLDALWRRLDWYTIDFGCLADWLLTTPWIRRLKVRASSVMFPFLRLFETRIDEEMDADFSVFSSSLKRN